MPKSSDTGPIIHILLLGNLPARGCMNKYQTMITVDELIAIAQEIESTDPIDWGMLNIDEQNAYKLIAAGVLENYNQSSIDTRELILLATVVKLTVENFVLNLRLLQNK